MTTNARRIEVTVGGASAEFQLLDESAPTTAAALWDTLPITGEWTHARWAGAACFVKVDRPPLASILELEQRATSIYRGTLAIRPGASGRAEVYLSYGQSESRHERGRTYVIPVARVTGDAGALFEALAATWRAGAAPATITQVREGVEA